MANGNLNVSLGYIIVGIIIAVFVCLFAYLVQNTKQLHDIDNKRDNILSNILKRFTGNFKENMHSPNFKHPSMVILKDVAHNISEVITAHYNLHSVYDGISHNSDFISTSAIIKIKDACEIGMRKIERALYDFANTHNAISKTFKNEHELKTFWLVIQDMYENMDRIYQNILYTDEPSQYANQLTYWLPQLYAVAVRAKVYADNNGVLPKIRCDIQQHMDKDGNVKENYNAASAGYSFPGMYHGDSQFDKDYQGRRSEFPQIKENFGQGDVSNYEDGLLNSMINNLPTNNYGNDQNYGQLIKNITVTPKHLENHNQFVMDQKRFSQTSGAMRIRDDIEAESIVPVYGLYGILRKNTGVAQGTTSSTPSAYDGGTKPFTQNSMGFVASWNRGCN